MAKREGFLRFGLFVYPVGHHIAAWRHPDAVANAGINFDYYRNVASLAEAAKFDLLFLADGAGTRGDNLEILSRTAHSYVAQFEPLTLLSALSAVTSHIGLVATASSSFNEPFHIARKFASLDHLSGGRAGYNLVTSASDFEARNFNLDRHYEHADRYERAEEFADVVTGLWNSWEDDAFLYDKEQARFFDPNKRHVLDHKGKHFSVQGPLNVPRSPQGHPVTVQAGSSAAGKELAAKVQMLFSRHSRLLRKLPLSTKMSNYVQRTMAVMPTISKSCRAFFRLLVAQGRRLRISSISSRISFTRLWGSIFFLPAGLAPTFRSSISTVPCRSCRKLKAAKADKSFCLNWRGAKI